jgi:hypothetical protein
MPVFLGFAPLEFLLALSPQERGRVIGVMLAGIVLFIAGLVILRPKKK